MKHQILFSLVISLICTTTNAQEWSTNGNDIYRASGNVGIGTSSPNGNLHIKNSTPEESGVLIIQGKQSGNSGNSTEIVMSTDWSTANNTEVSDQAGRKAIIKAIANNSWGENVRLGFFTSSNKNVYPLERMTISPGGNIGIGTQTPEANLTVAGDIHAREIRVKTDAGADFVFAKEYDLLSLEEVEEFIKMNKHLPEIAPEAEMIKNDINIGDFQIQLLQKIEELTLYIIELNKKNHQQSLRINTLEKQLNK